MAYSSKMSRIQFVKSNAKQNDSHSANQSNENLADSSTPSMICETTDNEVPQLTSKDYHNAWKLEKDPILAKFRNLAYEVDLLKNNDKGSKSRLHSGAYRASVRIDFTTKKIDTRFSCSIFIQGVFVASAEGDKIKGARTNAYDATQQNILMPYLRIVEIGSNSKALQTSVKPFTSLPSELSIDEAKNIAFAAKDQQNKESNINTPAIANRVIKPLNKFIMMEPKDQNDRSVMYALQQSADSNRMLLEYEYFFENEKVRCRVSVENEVLADVIDTSKSTAKFGAAVEACLKLKKLCWTIKTKQVSADLANENDELEEKITREALDINTLEDVAQDGDFQRKIQETLENFIASKDQEQIIFSSEFSQNECRVIHEKCKALKLTSKTKTKIKGKKKLPEVQVWRSFIDHLFDYLMAVGGETAQYRLVPPGQDVSAFVGDYSTRIKCYDKYRDTSETADEWRMRKQFIVMNEKSLQPDKLVCLSRCLVNMVFYGCSYPPAVMKEVGERSYGILERKKEEQKTIKVEEFQNSFVGSSDQNEQGSMTDEESSGLLACREKRLASNDSDFGPPSTKIAKTVEKGPLSKQGPQSQHSGQSKKALSKKFKKDKNSDNESKSGNNLILIENTGAQSSHQILRESVNWNKRQMSCKYDSSSNGTTCHVSINDQVIASETAHDKEEARTQACDVALARMKGHCWCIKVKQIRDAETETFVTREELCGDPTKGYKVPGQNKAANKMMQNMGWTGESLGKGGKGNLEPASYSIASQSFQVGRSGLGMNASMEEDFDKVKVKELLQEYASSNEIHDLVFSPDLSKEERDFIFTHCKKIHLRSKSRGKGDDIQMVVGRKWTPQGLLDHIRDAGGETVKYVLLAPSM